MLLEKFFFFFLSQVRGLYFYTVHIKEFRQLTGMFFCFVFVLIKKGSKTKMRAKEEEGERCVGEMILEEVMVWKCLGKFRGNESGN